MRGEETGKFAIELTSFQHTIADEISHRRRRHRLPKLANYNDISPH